MDSNSVTLMLRDITSELLSKAKAAKLEATQSDEDFDRGYKIAFYDVLSLLIQQADAFGVPLKDIGLSDFDPDIELL